MAKCKALTGSAVKGLIGLKVTMWNVNVTVTMNVTKRCLRPCGCGEATSALQHCVVQRTTIWKVPTTTTKTTCCVWQLLGGCERPDDQHLSVEHFRRRQNCAPSRPRVAVVTPTKDDRGCQYRVGQKLWLPT